MGAKGREEEAKKEGRGRERRDECEESNHMPCLFKSCLMKCRVLLWTLITLIASSRFHSLLRMCLKFCRLLLVPWLGQGLLQNKWSGYVCACLVCIYVDSGLVRDYLMLCGEQVWPWTFSVFSGFKCLLGVEICGWGRGVLDLTLIRSLKFLEIVLWILILSSSA